MLAMCVSNPLSMKSFHGVWGLCTKNPVSTLTHRSIRPFRSHYEGFFATKEVFFYSKKSYKGTTFGAKPRLTSKLMYIALFTDTGHVQGSLKYWGFSETVAALPGLSCSGTMK